MFLGAEKLAFYYSDPETVCHTITCPHFFLISLKKLKNCSPAAAAKNNFCIAVTKAAFPVIADANTGTVTYAFMMHMSWQ